MSDLAATGPLGVSGRGLEALRSTRRWVLLVAILMLVALVGGVVGNLIYAVRGSIPSNLPPELRQVTRLMHLGFAISTLLIDGVFAWFALQYARHLGSSLRTGDPAVLEAAFWWQRRFWTLQGALVIAFIALYIIGIIAFIVFIALHHP
ncbi:MAG: hypothetical protein ACRER1_07980 [Gammaproteobacteria bacterium]